MNPFRHRIGGAAALLLAGCAGTPAPNPHQAPPTPPAAVSTAGTPAALPAAIAAPADQVLKMRVAARGVQIYECRAATGGWHAWTFVAPEAELLDASGRTVGHHGAGPHWTFSEGVPPGAFDAGAVQGRITGRVTGRAEAPRAGAIPWLRLEAPEPTPSAAPGPEGEVRSIQRIHTDGGLAPAEPCGAAEAGRRARVPYTADYLFYGQR